MALRGTVYDVTTYLDAHPGGKPQLMKGAGRVADALFDKFHPWVAVQSILAPCAVGPLLQSSGASAERGAAAVTAAASASLAVLSDRSLTVALGTTPALRVSAATTWRVSDSSSSWSTGGDKGWAHCLVRCILPRDHVLLDGPSGGGLRVGDVYAADLQRAEGDGTGSSAAGGAAWARVVSHPSAAGYVDLLLYTEASECLPALNDGCRSATVTLCGPLPGAAASGRALSTATSALVEARSAGPGARPSFQVASALAAKHGAEAGSLVVSTTSGGGWGAAGSAAVKPVLGGARGLLVVVDADDPVALAAVVHLAYASAGVSAAPLEAVGGGAGGAGGGEQPSVAAAVGLDDDDDDEDDDDDNDGFEDASDGEEGIVSPPTVLTTSALCAGVGAPLPRASPAPCTLVLVSRCGLQWTETEGIEGAETHPCAFLLALLAAIEGAQSEPPRLKLAALALPPPLPSASPSSSTLPSFLLYTVPVIDATGAAPGAPVCKALARGLSSCASVPRPAADVGVLIVAAASGGLAAAADDAARQLYYLASKLGHWEV